MKSLLKGLAPLVLFLLTCSDQAVADPVVIDPLWKVTVTNNTGVSVFGINLTFTGTEGTIHDVHLVMNGAGAGAAVADVTSGGTGVGVLWNFPPGLPAGSTFMVQFSTDTPDIEFDDGFWLLNPPIPPAVDPKRDNLTVQEIPEPVSLLLFATGLIGVALKSRKNLKSSA